MKRYDMENVDGACMYQMEDGDWVDWDDVKELLEELELLKGLLDIERQKKQQLQKEIGYQVEP